MSERQLWYDLREQLRPYGWLLRVENVASPGTPDVAYVLYGHAGWLELKYLKSWPARGQIPVRIPSLTAAQCVCLESIAKAGGAAWLCLQIAGWYGLLPPHAARGIFRGQYTRAEVARFGVPFERIIHVLMKKDGQRRINPVRSFQA